MTRAEFISWLTDEVTISGTLAINMPEKEYNRIIDKGIRAMYEMNPDAMIDQYVVIPVNYFYTKEFRENRTIKFPECVLSVTKFVEMKRRNAMFGISDPDFSFSKAFQADMWLGSQLNMDSVLFRTVQWSVWDQMKNFTLVDIQHKWNRTEHSLLVLGHDPQVSVYCQLKVKAKEEDLFDNFWVQKWISAHCKLQAIKLMTTFSTNLIGGVSINMGAYQSEADKDIEECKAKFIENMKVPKLYTMP